MAVTKSGAVNARKWFPCVDEPNVKTLMTIEISQKRDTKGSDAHTNTQGDGTV